ncbi:MAG: zinc transporter ZupT [Fastidiosipilaceae bacterium]|jgi:ZIP family zinc transporter
MSAVAYALLMTTIAGLSTGIGGFISLFSKRDNTKFLTASLGFSAGVMIYVSFVNLFVDSQELLVAALGERSGMWAAIASLFGGMIFIGVIDRLIPSEHNPHEIQKPGGCADEIELSHTVKATNGPMMRTALFTALAIGIHNFPEGIATFIASVSEPTMALPITVAIALHNIPEGIAVAVPIFYATGSRKKAFWYSLLSGLAEPIGGLVGYLVLMPFLNDVLFGVVFGAVAGIMIYISLDELLPSAEEYGHHHLVIGGLVLGMAVMAVSMVLLG